MDYHRFVNRYASWARSSSYIAVAKRLLLARARPGQRVLDIGPGKGELLHALRQKYGSEIHLTALDRHSSVLQSLPPETTLIQANLWDLLDYENGVKQLPLPSGEYDLVILTEVIEHVIFPQILISEIARVLRPSGSLLISTPNIHMLGNRLAVLFGRDKIFPRTGAEGFISKLNYHPYGHVGHYSFASLRELLSPWFSVAESRSGAFNVPIFRYFQPIMARLFPSLATSIVMFGERLPLKETALGVFACPLTLSPQLILPDSRCLHPQIHSPICRSCAHFHTDFYPKQRRRAFEREKRDS